MTLVLNILWFIFGGFISGTLWILAGLLLALYMPLFQLSSVLT